MSFSTSVSKITPPSGTGKYPEDVLYSIFRFLSPAQIHDILPSIGDRPKIVDRILIRTFSDYVEQGLSKKKILKLDAPPKIKRVALKYFKFSPETVSEEELFLRLINPPIPSTLPSQIDKLSIDSWCKYKALLKSCRHGYIEVVRLLYDKEGDIFDRDPSFEAVTNGHLNILKLLYDNYFKGNLPNAVFRDCYADCLMDDLVKGQITRDFNQACFQGYSHIVEFFLQNEFTSERIYINYAFCKAVNKGNHDVVALLLKDKKMEPSKTGFRNFSNPCREGHVKVVKLLLDDGRFDPALNSDILYWNPFTAACQGGGSNQKKLAIVKLLLADQRANPEPKFCSYKSYQTPINRAVATGSLDLVKLLLSDKRVSLKKNSLLCAITQGGGDNLEVIKFLLKNKQIDPTLNENKAVFHACELNKPEVLKLLLSIRSRGSRG